MRISQLPVAFATVTLAVALASAGSAVASAATIRPVQGDRHVCAATAAPGHAECLALIPADPQGPATPRRPGSASPGGSSRAAANSSGAISGANSPGAAPFALTGYEPADLQRAYNLAAAAASAGAGQTVAVVDAFDDPTAESDLAFYRSFFDLPACTTGNGCFRKVNQDGAASPLPAPAGSTGWATEESLDLDMVSAICPRCHILLIEADGTDLDSLGTGVDSAVHLGARFVSNSYGGAEYPSETADDTYYHHPGVAITVSAGDAGYGVLYPAASPFVTSVGGTSLLADSATPRGWTETAWGDGESGADGDGTGSGCSVHEPKPAWQFGSVCNRRTVADVSAVADPDTGVWIYDTYDEGGWLVIGGTSAASPIIAAVYALAGTPGSDAIPAMYLYQHAGLLNDVTRGSNGTCGTYLCQAGASYDGPTGLGTPNGTAAFRFTNRTITVSSPGPRVTFKGRKISPLQLHATDSASGQTLRYRATGLPRGLSISATGKISGTPRALQYTTVTVTATDTTGTSGSTKFSWDDAAAGPITSGLSARRCVTARRGSARPGTAIQIAACTGGSAQRWVVYAGPGGEDTIELAAGDKSATSKAGCLAVHGGSTKAGTPIVASKCARTASLLWKPGSHGHLIGRHSGRCLSDPNAGPNGTQLVIAACATEGRQHWNLP